MKRNKGITLIALVITIIVLLILAGVAIAMLSGENGILTKAAKAKTETSEGKLDEASKLSKYEGILNNYSGKRWSIVKDQNGIAESVTNGEEIIPLGSQINYDPYSGVDKDYLKVTTSKTKNGYGDQIFEIQNNDEQKLTWKILGVDENGQIIIMPTTNLKDSSGNVQELYIGNKLSEGDGDDFDSDEAIEAGKRAVQYGIEEMNKICSIYGFGKGAISSRSVQIEDINTILNVTPSQVGTATYGKEFEYTSGEYFINGEWKQATTEKTIKMTSMSYWYLMGDHKDNTNIELYNLISDEKNNESKSDYFVASSVISASKKECRYNIFYKGNINGTTISLDEIFAFEPKEALYSNRGLRPVVSLKSDIGLKKDENGIYNIE